MQPNKMVATLKATILDGAAVSGEIDLSAYSSGVVHVPASWTDANMGFKAASESGGTFTILCAKASGTPIQIDTLATDGSEAYVLPEEVFSARFVKLWSKHKTAATKSDVNQSGDITLTLAVKS